MVRIWVAGSILHMWHKTNIRSPFFSIPVNKQHISEMFANKKYQNIAKRSTWNEFKDRSLDLNNASIVAIIIWFHLLSQVTSLLLEKHLDMLNYTWSFFTTRKNCFPLAHLSFFRQVQRINRCHTPIHFLWETLWSFFF